MLKYFTFALKYFVEEQYAFMQRYSLTFQNYIRVNFCYLIFQKRVSIFSYRINRSKMGYVDIFYIKIVYSLVKQKYVDRSLTFIRCFHNKIFYIIY